jgi:hypothetical protein
MILRIYKIEAAHEKSLHKGHMDELLTDGGRLDAPWWIVFGWDAIHYTAIRYRLVYYK